MWINDILQKKKSILALAPMADMTDSPFCQIVRKIGGADIVFREMVSSEAIVRDNQKTLGMMDFVEAERPIVQQFFGSNPLTMARAAAIIMEQTGPNGIDINMGCPVYKITSNFNGCALMKDPDLAAAIIREIKKAVGSTPLSVKIRLGWSDPDDFKTFIPIIEDAGADLITIHGRTKTQGYSGYSDWNRIAEAKQIARVPVLANGDIHKPEQVAEVLTITKADGVLIARGALGNPWFFKLCADLRNNYEYTNYEKYPLSSFGADESTKKDHKISLRERVNIILEHARLHVGQYGQNGMMTFRKHLAWYFKTDKLGFEIPEVKEFRGKLMRVNSWEELEQLLHGFLLKSLQEKPQYNHKKFYYVFAT